MSVTPVYKELFLKVQEEHAKWAYLAEIKRVVSMTTATQSRLTLSAPVIRYHLFLSGLKMAVRLDTGASAFRQ